MNMIEAYLLSGVSWLDDFANIDHWFRLSLQERNLVKYRTTGLVKWKGGQTLTKIFESVCVKQTIIAANNHYTGFGPDTVNIFRNILGLSDAKCEDKEDQLDQEECNIGIWNNVHRQDMSKITGSNVSTLKSNNLLYKYTKLKEKSLYD